MRDVKTASLAIDLNLRIMTLMQMKRLKALKAFTVAVGTALLAACGGNEDILPEQSEKNLPANSNSSTTTVSVTPVIPPKDFRAVWIATVDRIDWPNSYGSTATKIASQKAYYERYLDTLQANHINAVMFQVRPMADAFYASPYEPWSKYLSGRRGTNPGWEPLPWLISETHKRGIQFHAWINPYRIAVRSSSSASYPTLESTIPAEWTKDYNKVRIYNPALPEVRQRIADIIADLLQANVDSMVIKVQQTIRSIKPNCLFSVSPQGNYDNDYSVMYCDVKKWSKNGWIDVLIPQIYWSTETYFSPRLKIFSDLTVDSKLMVGYGLYRFSGTATDPYYQTSADLKKQFDIAYAISKVKGSILYSAKWMLSNPVKTNAVIKKQFNTLELPPYLGHEPMVQPAAPQNVKADGLVLSWNAVSNCYYAVYRSNGDGEQATLVSITYDTTATVPENGDYFVTAVTKGLNAESNISTIVNCDKEKSGIRNITM